VPLCEGLTLCRGRRPCHARKDRVGTWETSRSADGHVVPQGPHREGEEPKPMMHEREKSDPAIVAVKPTNKAERSAAELVEPRARAEGNARQQSTHRAQNRVCVSQALERIRQAARQRKKDKFTTLLHHISTDHLELAFLELKEDAAAGVGGLRWQDYAVDLERNLENLHARVH